MKSSETGSLSLWRNALWLVSGNGIRFLVSGLYFVLLARLLGPSQFGFFSAVLALSNLACPLAYLGQSDLLVQWLARSPHLRATAWGYALVISVIGGCLTTGILLGPLQLWLPGLHWESVLWLLLSEVLCTSVQYVQRALLVSQERIPAVAVIDTSMAAARLGLVSLAWLLGWSSLIVWSRLYVGVALGSCIVTHMYVVHQIGSDPASLSQVWQQRQQCWQQARAGWDFALGLVAIKTFADLDKLLLPRLATAVAGGVYSAAYRLINIAQTPVYALLTSGFAELCRQGHQGFRAAYRHSLRSVGWIVGYAILATGGLAVVSAGIPSILGEDYRETAVAVRWLSGVVGLESLHILFSNFLTGIGHQRIRGYLQVVALGLNGILNVWWIPIWGWRGAAGATLVTEVELVISLGMVIGWQWWQSRDPGEIRT